MVSVKMTNAVKDLTNKEVKYDHRFFYILDTLAFRETESICFSLQEISYDINNIYIYI